MNVGIWKHTSRLLTMQKNSMVLSVLGADHFLGLQPNSGTVRNPHWFWSTLREAFQADFLSLDVIPEEG